MFMGIENTKYEEQVRYLKKTEIDHEKSMLFHDFLLNLITKIDETYLGREYINDDIDIRLHFKWCWDETIKIFEKENIFFENKNDINLFFYLLFINTFYKINDNSKTLLILRNHVNYLFTSDNKSDDEFDYYYEIYTELKNLLRNYGRA